MNALHEEQRLFHEAVDRYLERSAATQSTAGFSAIKWARFAEMGWLGLGLPEEMGGFLTLHDAMLLMEKLGAAGAREPLMDNLILCGHLLASHGSAEQTAVCEDMVQGKAILALALAETGSRHDWTHVETTLHSDTLLLSGDKCLVACGQFCSHLLVLARESNGSGLTAALLPVDRAGITLRHYTTYDGRDCSDVTFEQVQVLDNDVVGPRAGGQALVEPAMQRAYVALACEAAGAMRSAYAKTLEYARTRKQFGKVLTANQAYQHALVDMYVAVEEAQGLAHHASAALDVCDPMAARWASGAKAFACIDGRQLGEQAVQLHGAIGMTQEYALGTFYTRLAAIANEYGDADWHLLRISEFDSEVPDGQ